MLFGKWLSAPTVTAPRATMPQHVMLPPGGTIPGPQAPGLQPTMFHSFPSSMPATNTGVFTTNQGSGSGAALPTCPSVGCTGAVGCASVNGPCNCPQPDGSVIQCRPVSVIFNNQNAQGGPYQSPPPPPDNGSAGNDGTSDQNTDSSSDSANGGSTAATSTGSQPVCDDGFSYDPGSNMCQPNPGGPAPTDPNATTVTTTTVDPSTGAVSTTQVVSPVPISVPLPGIPDAPLFYQTPAFKVGMIALGVSVLGVAAILVHRARSA